MASLMTDRLNQKYINGIKVYEIDRPRSVKISGGRELSQAAGKRKKRSPGAITKVERIITKTTATAKARKKMAAAKRKKLAVAVKRRKKSGWWGDQTGNKGKNLPQNDLKKVLEKKSKCQDLDSSGVYMYINNKNRKIYIGKAAKQTLLKRQAQHLRAASYAVGQVGKFDRILSQQFNEKYWTFYAKKISGLKDIEKKIDKCEKRLISKYCKNDKSCLNIQNPRKT